MSTSIRRIPLSSNPNAANSPMRASAAALLAAKKGHSHAEVLREEPYGQPPPAKRQMIERSVASPTPSRSTRILVRRAVSRAASRATVGTGTSTSTTQRTSRAISRKSTEEDVNAMRQWHSNIRARFPNMVFYFESIPDDVCSKLAKQVARLGAREEKFFSIDITHVVTSRPIPSEKAPQDGNEANADAERPQTIDPSLLNRNIDSTNSVRRKPVFDTVSKRRPIIQDQEVKPPKARNTDVLHRARDMGKKIWSLEKLQKILPMALDPEPNLSAFLGHGRETVQSASKVSEKDDVLQLIRNERVPTFSSKDLYQLKEPYIYVYDIDEKTRPIMVREYQKVADPKDGDWPQFRSASHGRCPFVQDNYDFRGRANREEARAKGRVAKVVAETAAADTKPAEATQTNPKPATGKRTLTQMEDGHNRGVAALRANEPFDRSRVSNPPSLDFRSQNAFMSHAKVGRFLAGEPVASGVQPSNVTSAIRSQMISSTTGGLGAKAGTSKEIHGLQRRVVLQKASTPALSQDLSSRRMAEMSHDSNTFTRSASASMTTNRKLDTVDEEETARQREKLRRTASAPTTLPKQNRDPKPGYCENCQDKFPDFEAHIVSRRHRRFADNDDNWAQLDALLAQLKRVPRCRRHAEETPIWQ
ncbi:Hsk1-interacting molecule 1 [Madurella mycetomatis]|uniref:Hsk1-interacting molecule 1 n=1 Tax=Madurella mycetomatis TaxID=100816 RepID=A0A175WC01_9PEZI|nr:Hsk1-interacting molecule 1 [Madurella mycetomatis]